MQHISEKLPTKNALCLIESRETLKLPPTMPLKRDKQTQKQYICSWKQKPKTVTMKMNEKISTYGIFYVKQLKSKAR
jgi:hypothetical protein